MSKGDESVVKVTGTNAICAKTTVPSSSAVSMSHLGAPHVPHTLHADFIGPGRKKSVDRATTAPPGGANSSIGLMSGVPTSSVSL